MEHSNPCLLCRRIQRMALTRRPRLSEGESRAGFRTVALRERKPPECGQPEESVWVTTGRASGEMNPDQGKKESCAKQNLVMKSWSKGCKRQPGLGWKRGGILESRLTQSGSRIASASFSLWGFSFPVDREYFKRNSAQFGLLNAGAILETMSRCRVFAFPLQRISSVQDHGL